MAVIQTFDASVNLLRAVLWQYDGATRLRALLDAKQGWYDINQRDFWDAWYRDVFDLRTANEFGLAVWAVILDMPLVINAPPSDDRPVFGFGEYNRNFFDGNFGRDAGGAYPLTLEQKRLVLRLRYFQLVTRGAVPEINAFLREVFAGMGGAHVADNLDMSAGYVFDFVPSAGLRQVLDNYDILPRPAGVRVGYLVQPRVSFGFDPYWSNFGNSNFYGVFPPILIVDLLGTTSGLAYVTGAMSATFALDLDFVSSETPDPRITFSGGANGTRVNSAGVIEAAVTPRYDYDPLTLAPRGLMSEEARTNLMLRSAELDNATWTKIAVTVSADAATSPDGSTSAEKVIATSASTGHQVNQAAATTAAATTFDVYAKAAGLSWMALGITDSGSNVRVTYFNLATGSVGTIATGITASIVPAGNGWYRCIITVAAAFAGTNTLRVYVTNADGITTFAGDDISGVYIWGAQLELGAFATSYIPTTTAAVTRTADIAAMTGANFSSWYNASQGTLLLEWSQTSLAPIVIPFSIDDGSAGNSIRLQTVANTGAVSMVVVAGSSTQASIGAGTISAGATQKMVAAFELNNFGTSLNGGAVGTDVSGTVPIVDRLSIGSNRGLVAFVNGHIRSLRSQPLRLSNAVLPAMTGNNAPLFSGTVIGAGSVTGVMTASPPVLLSGTTVAQGTVTGAMANASPLALAGTTTGSGSIAAAGLTITVALPLAGTTTGSGSIAGALSIPTVEYLDVGSGTFVIPAGKTSMDVYLWANGGLGGSTAGGGAGGGAYALNVPVTPGDSHSYRVTSFTNSALTTFIRNAANTSDLCSATPGLNTGAAGTGTGLTGSFTAGAGGASAGGAGGGGGSAGGPNGTGRTGGAAAGGRGGGGGGANGGANGSSGTLATGGNNRLGTGGGAAGGGAGSAGGGGGGATATNGNGGTGSADAIFVRTSDGVTGGPGAGGGGARGTGTGGNGGGWGAGGGSFSAGSGGSGFSTGGQIVLILK